MTSKHSTTKLITNRRARFDYTFHDEFNVGIQLTGPEVRSVRDGHVNLKGSYVTIKNNELWLTNASFTLKPQKRDETNIIDTRPRKLLAKRSEIERLIAAKDSGLTIVPIHMTTNTKYIKLAIASAKGKKLYDKRETIRRRDSEREAARAIKQRV